MAKQIILSPEVAELLNKVLGMESIAFNCGECDASIEALLLQIAESLPKNCIGFKHNGKAFVKKAILDALPDSKDFVIPVEQQPKKTKQKK
jgi:hypothetical protein